MPRPAHTQSDLPSVPTWDRLPVESDPAWAAFTCYRDMQPKRSIARVARTLGKNDSLLDRWSSRHRWVARSDDWDIYQARLRMAERQAAREAEECRLVAEREAKLRAMHESGYGPDRLFTGASTTWGRPSKAEREWRRMQAKCDKALARCNKLLAKHEKRQ